MAETLTIQNKQTNVECLENSVTDPWFLTLFHITHEATF